MDSLKWVIRIGALVLFVLLMFYGYKAKMKFEESKQPISESYYFDEFNEFEFDEHGHAYKGMDDGSTLYIDDPKLHKSTEVPTGFDLDEKPPGWNKVKREVKDDFEVKGRVILDKDDTGVGYTDSNSTYDGYIP